MLHRMPSLKDKLAKQEELERAIIKPEKEISEPKERSEAKKIKKTK